MIANHKIAYQNVASKYYTFHPEDMEKVLRDFTKVLENADLHLDGRMFFSIISDPQSDVMTAEIFMSVKEDSIKEKIDPKEDIRFRSYFALSPMVMSRIMDEFDQNSQEKYWDLIGFLAKNQLSQTTPVIAEFRNSISGRNYVEMSVGYSQ
ncbi:DUF5085 family protein [Oceanobacillus kimchii]|uniref:DUF5085 family protein n=1 Tax=Oceanobacillus kimchii TaxID=746691 RepID=UPI000345F6B7|nr:DUF5085 family protein [Oceanobacillus kimchii]MCT1576494.1 DUF5085 family protein [Oceanobacillus kimchii]MCT2136130.1 DUF5085 family protein [Oceanobacillus kimchii]